MPHIHEKIDFCSEVFIVYKNKVLLRKHDKYGFWLSVGGHIEPDEDPLQAAVREVKEEVGLDVELYFGEKKFSQKGDYTEIPAPEFMNRHRINETHEHIIFVYFAKAKTDKLVLSETEKTRGCKWFTKEELNNPEYGIRDTIKLYAENALSKLAE